MHLNATFQVPSDPISYAHADSHLDTANQTLWTLLLTSGGQASYMELLYSQALQLTSHSHGVLEEGDSQHERRGT